MPKSYRIRTEVGVDKYINVNLEQDWESLEVLSLKILSNDVYSRFCANYGVVVGRVFVNNGFGLPNAKVSVFIPIDEADELNPIINELYPYKTITDTNEEGYRYNLLPKTPSYKGHKSTGSFPNVGDVIMDESYVEVFDKYYRFTVTTNESGDFMIFGVPVGNQTIVMDVDLSDIGCFSLSPQDLIRQGLATETQVDGSTFKTSTNLRELPQIKNLVFDVDVRPFWGDDDLCQVGITRVDFDLTKQANINIQPTSVFMGSIISTTNDDSLRVSCKPKNNTGNLCELIPGPGEILAIRQTINNDSNGLPILEEYVLEEGGKVIDGDGTYLINVPMNLDYIYTNEFGQQVISNDPSKGIPTKGKYRFKFKWQNQEGLQSSFLRANFLVPNIKEYGWTNNNDPFDQQTITYNYPQIPVGSTNGTVETFTQSVVLIKPILTNVESYQIVKNGQTYNGNNNEISFNVGDTLQIISVPIDNTQPQTITYTSVPPNLIDLYKSYAFSLDWNDYVDIQDAINCEDSFYEFNYNKVYTTAMFLDRYKNGVGRAKHLGIKEIDNRSCKSTVNTFPVNDIIRNFDFIFFVFNILINILTFPILVLIFVAHLIALIWPVLKYLLLFLGPFIVGMGVKASIDLSYYILSLFDVTIVGPVFSVATVLQIIAQGVYALATIAAGVVFTIFYTKFFIENTKNGKIDNFPRIGLPMISYPDCTSCECDCGVASLDDDFDQNSIQQDIQNAQGSNNNSLIVSTPNSLIAPINSPSTYEIEHPNFVKSQDDDDNDDPVEPFRCSGDIFQKRYKSIETLLNDKVITQEVAVRAVLDFKRMISGYDVISSTDDNRYLNNESILLKSPQPFLFSANKRSLSADERYFAYPNSVTFSQKLNEFNTRDKYFNNINRIKTWVNPSINPQTTEFNDQVVVVLMNPGTSSTIGIGNACTFQDPKYMQNGSDRLVNLTGATINKFENNAITGTTITGQTSVTINYANPNNPNGSLPVSFIINQPSISEIPVIGNPTIEESYLRYATDIEYFQLITGLTVSNFIDSSNTTTSQLFPNQYLLHDFKYLIPNCNFNNIQGIERTINDVVKTIPNYENYEICIFVRGVDPHTAKQTIRYDLSRIFGYSTNNQVIIEGDYYLNIPIQQSSGGIKPTEHDTQFNNNVNLYFKSFTFTPDPNQYSAFTSDLPYYYLSTDDSISANYIPSTQWQTNTQRTTGPLIQTITNNYSIRRNTSTFVVGGSYLGWRYNTAFNYGLNVNTNSCNKNCEKKQYYNTLATNNNNGPNQFFINAGGNLSSLYSPVYYRYGLQPVNFNDSQRIIMRSDRLPTSTKTQNGAGNRTGFALHQNDNFAIYSLDGVINPPTITAGGDIFNGDSFDEDEITQTLTSTLTCDGMVPLSCYSGSGSNVGVLPEGQCDVPSNRMVNGCYCLLNKKYVAEYGQDVRLFLEWKVRFTMNFAACRGVFGQVFQNNWINGVLYMFSFNKRSLFGINPNEPKYKYCDDVIIFDELSNNFYYRSSPWNKNNNRFIGKSSPNSNLPQIITKGLGYNQKQIQFPTTIVDLGPRDSFINEICCNGIDGFGSYFSDQITSTSYQDNSSIIQLGFLSRILNQGVRQRIIPISVGGNNSEGKGIIQFFNSERGGQRIDGDWAQMLSINSEWKVLPFITENVPNSNYIYFGDNGATGNNIEPIMGLFFQTPEENINYRKNMAPGVETYSFNPPIEEYFGYDKSQNVPHYKWWIKTPSNQNGVPNIFGSEDNNWYTDNGFNGGFFSKRYQDLNFNTNNEKYQTNLSKFGYITSYDINGNPLPITPLNSIIQGSPYSNLNNSVIVGAPYHFYFGLRNGKTAIDRFYKFYVRSEE